MIGTQLGHYRIVAKLGQGGMGEVFEAEDGRLKRRILEERGDDERARELCEKFVSYWQNGDLKREEIADARRFLAAETTG